MFEHREKDQERQGEFWVERKILPRATPNVFYRKLERALKGMDFAESVRDICRPAYAETEKGGRPGIDPAVYFKMLMVGFFENLPSERAIASRCADSLSLRAFLGYDLSEDTPEHSSFTVIRKRLSLDQFQQCHEVVLKGLRKAGLLKGKNLGIDSSVMEANASLRELVKRNTGQAYFDYVKELAAAAGIDPEDTKAVRSFDRKRKGRKTSNEEWVNPHDPEAKVGRDKHGATDMLYKPEHVTDLESGAIVQAEVRPGNAGDAEGLTERMLQASETLGRVCGDPLQQKVAQSVTADEGYFSAEQAVALQAERFRTVIGDPHSEKRNRENQPAVVREALGKAKRAVKSKSGKALLRKRGEHLERSFAHLLDQGGMRRATLKGCEELTKRHVASAMAYNMSLLMRMTVGVGTPKQWLASVTDAAEAVWRSITANLTAGTMLDGFPSDITPVLCKRGFDLRAILRFKFSICSGCFSTGC